ncbi:MAG: hypothetical protein ACR2QM_18345 [Longimicrobiales bacterium]
MERHASGKGPIGPNRWEIEDLDRLQEIEEAFGWRASQHVIGPMRKEFQRIERLTGAVDHELPIPSELINRKHEEIAAELNPRERVINGLANLAYGVTLAVMLFVALRFMPISTPAVNPLSVLAIAMITGMLVARRRIRSHRLL